MPKSRDASGRFSSSSSQEKLHLELCQIFPGFVPNRAAAAQEMPLEERLKRAQQLARKYEKQGLPLPASLLLML